MTSHDQQADDFLKIVDVLMAMVPRLEPRQQSQTGFLRSHLNIPEEFVRDAIAAVEQNAPLTDVGTLDAAAAHDVLQFIDAYRPALIKLETFTRALRFTLDFQYASLAANALQIYEIAKGVARDPRGAEVATHVQNLRQALGRRGRPKVARQITVTE